MTNKRITELTALDGDDVADNDVLAIVDVSDTTMAASGTTKKITVAELVTDSALTNKFWPNSTTALTGANLANGDKLAVVDVGSPDVPKYITADELAQGSQFSSRYAAVTDFPDAAWTSWTPSVSSSSGTITTLGTVEGYYQQIGRVVHCVGRITITTKGTANGALEFILPVTGRSTFMGIGGALGTYRETTNTGVVGVVYMNGTGVGTLMENDNTTVFNNDGDTFRFSFTYEAAS
jgi:hypothetical protein